MDDLGAAATREPHTPVVPPAVQITTALMLSDKGHEGGEHIRHGAGTLPQLGGLTGRRWYLSVRQAALLRVGWLACEGLVALLERAELVHWNPRPTAY